MEEQDNINEQNEQDGIQIQVNRQQQQGPNAGLVRKSLSRWARIGLDLGDAGFSKLHSKESHFSDDDKKYDLEPEKFESFKLNLIEKTNRMHSNDIMRADDNFGNLRDILREYTLLNDENIADAAELRWPVTEPTFTDQEEMDIFTDKQIKASVIGNYINESLTDNAKNQLRADQNHFEVEDVDGNPYYDGPSYYWKIAELVDPDNGHLIENVRKQLRSLHIKDYGYSVIKMLAEFKNLKRRIAELGGTYDEDDQFLDFWDSLKTMKEKRFAQYVVFEKDAFRKLPRNRRGTVDSYIRDMTSKQVAMEADGEWNKMSPEDAMVMAFVTMMEDPNHKQSKPQGAKKQDDEDLSPEERQKRYEARIPDWKKIAPKEGEPTTIVKNGKTYHWCTKCRNGKGMWALHTTEEHRGKSASNHSNQSDKNKKVSFQADTKVESSKESKETSKPTEKQQSGPSIQVKKDLLNNAKAYLAQFQDFPKGGVQG
jgi:hypothetical protein